ncbi:MAG: hypothetical protein JKY71_06085 [Alphaproteobacteria bacterium]|nr:hypothetical protein [Alphaproteobacteria bacterium]
MTKHEQARSEAKTEMQANWAQSIGNCGLCPKAARGECSAVNAMAKAAGIDEDDAKKAVQLRINGVEQADDATPTEL